MKRDNVTRQRAKPAPRSVTRHGVPDSLAGGQTILGKRREGPFRAELHNKTGRDPFAIIRRDSQKLRALFKNG